MEIIETHGLCKRYGDAMRVSHLDLRVPEGCVYGFLGPNGAGKSTTLKMILGLVHPTAGSISVFGKEVNGHNRLDMLKQVGSLIESPSYYGHLTGEENLKVVQTLRGVPEKDVYEVLEIVRLEGQRSKKVAHYSLGMKQRLGLAAALLGYPKLLILDEPTSGLDPVSRDELLQILSEYIEDGEHSVLFSTHITGDLERAADYITYISYGELFFSGSKDEFVDMFRIVKGGTEELSADLKEKAVGVRTFSTGFEALVKTEDTGAFSSLSIEPATIDEIVVFTSKKGDDYE